MKKIIILSTIVFLLSVVVVKAAPLFKYDRTILPESNNTFELGTSTLQWLNIFGKNGFFENITVTGTCTGCGSGGSGGVGTSTNPLMATYFVATSTSATSTLPNLEITNLRTGYILAGDAYPLATDSSVKSEVWGDIDGAVQMGIGNRNAGTAAYNCIFQNNDRATSAVTDYYAQCQNSGRYSDTSFGTGMANPSQTSFENTMGQMAYFVSSTTLPNTSSAYSWFTGGRNLTNQKMTMLNNGYVGIGTTTPGSKLEVTGNIRMSDTNLAYSILNTDSGNSNQARLGIKLKPAAASEIRVAQFVQDGSFALGGNITNTTVFTGAAMVVNTAGNMGIGTTTPAAKLDVSSTGAVVPRVTSTNGGGDAAFRFYSGSTFKGQVGWDQADDVMALYSAGNSATPALAIPATSLNVGIGTSTPAARMEIYNTDSTVSLAIDGNAGGIDIARIYRGQAGSGTGWGAAWSVASNNPQMKFLQGASSQNAGTIVSAIGYDSTGGGFFIATSSVNTGLRGVEPFFIKASTGNVGLGGTTTPWRSVSIKGTVAIDGLTSATGQNAVCINPTTKDVVNAGNTTCATSSGFVKDITGDITPEVAKYIVNRMKGITFNYKGDTEEHYGFTAEQAAQVDKEVFEKFGVKAHIAEYAKEEYTDSVTGHVFKKGDPSSVNYMMYTAVLTVAMQNLDSTTTEKTSSSNALWFGLVILALGLGVSQYQIYKLKK